MLVHHFTTPESAAAIHAGGFSLRHYGRTSKAVRRDASKDLRGVYVSPGDVPPGYVVPHPYDHRRPGGLVRATLRLKNPVRVAESRSLVGPDETGHEATKRLLKAGHDGVITDTEIIAFDPRSLTPMTPDTRLARPKPPQTIQPMDETPKTVEELKALGVRHTLTADGRPKVSQRSLTAALNRRKRPSNTQLGMHLLETGAHDVAAGTHDTAMRDWYGPHAREMEHGFSRMFGYKDHPDAPAQVFAKVLVGLTSPGNNPNQNVDATVRMLKAANGDVRRLPAGNVPEFRAWLRRHVAAGGTIPSYDLGAFGGDVHGRPVETVLDPAEWAHRHGYRKDSDAAYYGVPTMYDPEAKRVTHIFKGGKWVPPQHLHPMTHDAQGRIVVRDKDAPIPDVPMGSHRVHVPILDEFGRLQPKKWVAYAKSLAVGVRGLQRLIREKGAKGAAEFLTQEHDPAVVLDTRKRLVSPSGGAAPDYLPPGDKLAGFLMFGPKIGSFMANIHDSQRLGKYLTADMWFARWFRRHFAKLKGNKELINPDERRTMYQAAQTLHAHLGTESIAQLQAILWGAEQALYRSYHQKAPSGNLLEATKRAMRRHFGLASADNTTRRPSGHTRLDLPARPSVEYLNTEGLL